MRSLRVCMNICAPLGQSHCQSGLQQSQCEKVVKEILAMATLALCRNCSN
jgi:hypothetical protein